MRRRAFITLLGGAAPTGARDQRGDLVAGHERAAFYCDARH